MTSKKYIPLSQIHSPQDLKKLDIVDLEKLAGEIREYILDVVSQTGGHVGASFGVVELTLALHYLFDSPRDSIFWDVSHQAYPHKLLTGRYEAFKTLRQYKGIAGFCKRDESEHDIFGAGHASTAISSALGLAEAKYHNGDPSYTIAVAGDGALTGGVAYEGLNNVADLNRNIIIIFNDNEMSISPNVGALSAFVSRATTGHYMNLVREEVKHLMKKIPTFGDKIYALAKKSKEVVKGILSPGLFFECLGLRYIGPIDGHNIQTLVETLKDIKELKGPILLHVLTEKGHGCEFLEGDPLKCHAFTPFDRKTGKAIPKKNAKITYTKVLGNTLQKLAKVDDKVIAITAAMKEGTGLQDFAKNFPDRFYDVGIAEQHAVLFSAGLSLQKMKPFACIYSTFLQRAFDQIVHDVCLQKLNVCFAMDRAGLVGDDGPTHHGVYDISYLRELPNMVIMSPKDENELQHMLYTATTFEGPKAIRYPRGEGLGIPMDETFKTIPIGKGEVIKMDSDKEYVLFISLGHMVQPSIEAAELLNKDGINSVVINARFVKPLDTELILKFVKDAKLIVTVEENVLTGGFGSSVLEFLNETYGNIPIPIKRIGVPDRYIDHGSQSLLRKEIGLDPEGIAKTVRRLVPHVQTEKPTITESSQNDFISQEPAIQKEAIKNI